MTPDPAAPRPLRFTARSPEDLLAVVPVVLGFTPADSVVMLTFGAARTFHARVDLPPPGSGPFEVGGVVDSLLAPARQHGVSQVVFVLYSVDPEPAERVSRRLLRRFRSAGIEVVDVLRADGRRWFSLLHPRRCHPRGVPYDVSSHPFAAQAVLDGRVTHGSRAELAASVAPDQLGARRVAAAVDRVRTPDPAEWVTATTRRLAAARERPDDDVAARLLLAVAGVPDGIEAACEEVPRHSAVHHVELWTDLLRRAPGELAGPAGGVLAFLAWLAGNGALAWCAIDRSQAAAPGHSLAGLVSDLLTRAIPPEAWVEASARRHPA